jgi:hypothetical protein
MTNFCDLKLIRKNVLLSLYLESFSLQLQQIGGKHKVTLHHYRFDDL